MRVTMRGGTLRDDSGQKIARVVKAEVEVDDSWLAALLTGGRGEIGEQIGLVLGDGESEGKGTTEADVEAVWACYVTVMKPRNGDLKPDERRVIRDALKVATVEECCGAIRGCHASRFHMGENDRRKKYNRLTQIIKGRRGQETTRERIDYFLDILERAGGAGANVPSGDAGVIQRKKTDVQRGHRFSDDEKAVKTAEEAEAWLAEHGIETMRGEDGYPTFRWASPGGQG